MEVNFKFPAGSKVWYLDGQTPRECSVLFARASVLHNAKGTKIDSIRYRVQEVGSYTKDHADVPEESLAATKRELAEKYFGEL